MSYMIDVLILVLLAGTLGYAFLVERRVRNLMRILRDMEPMVGEFSAAVDKSENSVTMLRAVADKVRTPFSSAPQKAEDDTADIVSFRSTREMPSRPVGVTSVSGKSDLVRGFFETARSRGA